MSISRILFFSAIFLVSQIGLSQNNTASVNAAPFCIGLTYTSAAGTPGANIQEPWNNYDCLTHSPNPSWYFLKCSASGTIDLSLSAPQDIDFIIYGPFQNYSNLLNSTGSLNNVVDCSYSSTNMETPSIPNMSSGEYYLLLVTNYANTIQQISLTQTGGTGSLDCTVHNEGGSHFIFGETYYDENNNGTFDNNDFGIPGVQIDVDPLSQFVFSNYDGGFHFYNQTPDSVYYTVDASLQDFALTTSPTSYSFGLDSTLGMSDTLMFGFYPDNFTYSVDPDIIVNSVSCVNNNNMWVNIYNDGTLPSQGEITITLDDEINYDTTTYVLGSQTGNELTFSYDSLYLFQNLNFQIFTTPDTSLAVGDTIKTIISIETFDTLGVSLGIQTDTLCSPVFCSYDPNFKESLPNGGMPSEIIQPQDSIEYVIHFQNTGTAEAVNIVIEDTIHSNLDLSTFKFLSASHGVNITIDTNKLAKFVFNNINLPDSNTNEPLSHGYIKFRINLINGLLPNDSISNDVAIFFDNNLPIYTNIVYNEIDCYIKPDLSGTTVNNDQIHTNLSDPNLSFAWYLDGVLIPGETDTYYDMSYKGNYSVVVTNEYGCESTFTYSNSAGIEGLSGSFSVSPNPFVNELKIFNSIEKEVNVQIIDAEGRVVFAKNTISKQQFTLNTSEWAKGVYLIELQNSEGNLTRQKVIKY